MAVDSLLIDLHCYEMTFEYNLSSSHFGYPSSSKTKVIFPILISNLQNYFFRIYSNKGAFNRKISLLPSKLNIELKKKLVRCNFRTLRRDLYTKKIGSKVCGKL